MKRTMIGLTALAAACAASAQSSVTLFGVVDASISHYANSSRNPLGDTLRVSRTLLTNSAYNSSRLGFRGTEDLGGGLAASFWLEAPLSNDDGNAAGFNFARRSTVSLSGGFGEVRLGRDYTPTFWNDAIFDPFNTNGVGTNIILSAHLFNPTGGAGGFGANANYVRASNSIAYFLPPTLGGFYGQFQYAFHEQTKYAPGTATPNAPNNARAGRYVGGRVGYANGPVDVALAYGDSSTGDAFFAGTTDSVKTLNFGASYDFGPVKLFGELSRARSERDYALTPPIPVNDVDLNGYLLGLSVPVGVGLIRAAYSRVKYDDNLSSTAADPKADKLALGYVHNLSKRTALYATVARVTNKNGAALTVGSPAFSSTTTFTPRRSTGYDIGIRHGF